MKQFKYSSNLIDRSTFPNSLCFDDILIEPKYSDISSRKEISLTQQLDEERNFVLPVLSSPMDTVTGSRMAASMDNFGGLGVLHRYNTIEEQIHLVRQSFDLGSTRTAAAVGVQGDYRERALELQWNGVDIICIDIAHGHHSLMKEALKQLKEILNSSTHVMAGNVATREGFTDLANWGADSIRVGIGGGSICSTRIKTGHGVPTLQSILNCSYSTAHKFSLSVPGKKSVPLIADGGIKTSGDIVKAFAAGADFVMLGSMLAGTPETPGEAHLRPLNDGSGKLGYYKTYRGMSSAEAQIDWRGHASSLEGVSTILKERPPVYNILSELVNDIRSGLSYSGAKTISELQQIADFICQSTSGSKESSTHINYLNE